MYNPQETEKNVLEFWEKNKIFEKLRKKNKGKKRWSFIDGPITANNPMGVHHAWGRTYKDLFQRFKAMQGFEQRFQNGFDCQGLWVEREEEKDLGLENKEDIERFGILNFVRACKKRIEKFSNIQKEQSIKLGQWMDWDNSYYTMSDNNNLHNWHLLKKYFEKGMLFKGKDAVPWCWRCGTASSKHDIVTEGYREVTHPALFMQFPLKDAPEEYFLIFTTTPWTVPANVAIAVNPNIKYVKAENQGVKYWLAKSRLNELEGKYKVLGEKNGSELKGKEYIMPYRDLEVQANSPHKVVLWDLASEEEGTGIVHIAPGCGTEDFDLGKKEALPVISPLDEAGIYAEGYGEFSLRKYSEVNKAVLKDLELRRFIYKAIPYKHRYPHCWRCGQELVFRLVDEWYIKCLGIREKLIKENRKIKWFPEYGKTRQEDWFKNMGDWLISRKRYWGLPLPIWECECGAVEVIGSLEELKKKAVDKKKVEVLPEIHRPWIDEIKIKCNKCGKEVSRIKDVGDAWLDAGIVPFSTLNYLNDREYWKKWFPADLISENMPGQYRGWFNALMWASVALTGKAPFKSLFGYETLKDEKGEEMHKSKGNAIWFDDAVEKIGADPMRLLYCLQNPIQELRFGFNAVKEPKNNLNILFNISKLIKEKFAKVRKSQDLQTSLTRNLKILVAETNYSNFFKGTKKFGKYFIEDKWLISRFNSVIKKVTNELEELHPHLAARELQNFWLNDLSRKYIQLVRERLANNDETANCVLEEVYIGLIKLCAPFVPFIIEKTWQELRERKIVNEESVHLCDWLKSAKGKIDEKLEALFESAFEIIEKGMAERDKMGIGLKWPLAKAFVTVNENLDTANYLKDVIARQLNVKEIELKSGKEFSVSLDSEITPELEAEGYAREFARNVQVARKDAGLQKEDIISLKISSEKDIKKMLTNHIKFLKERVNAKEIEFIVELPKKTAEFTIKRNKISIFFS